MRTATWTDPIVAETREWREGLLKESGYDLARLTERLIESQARHGEKLVSLEGDGTPHAAQTPANELHA